MYFCLASRKNIKHQYLCSSSEVRHSYNDRASVVRLIVIAKPPLAVLLTLVRRTKGVRGPYVMFAFVDNRKTRRICRCRTKSLYGQSAIFCGVEQTQVTRKSQARFCQTFARRLPVEARTAGCELGFNLDKIINRTKTRLIIWYGIMPQLNLDKIINRTKTRHIIWYDIMSELNLDTKSLSVLTRHKIWYQNQVKFKFRHKSINMINNQTTNIKA